MMEINEIRHKIRVVETYSDYRMGCCNVFLDDVQLKGVVSYKIEHGVNSLARITLYAYSDTVIEETGHVEWVATPETIEQAFSILRKAMENKEHLELVNDGFRKLIAV